MTLSAVAYGIAFILFVLSFKQLVRTTTKHNYTQRLCFIIYITLMLILGTLFVGALAKMTQLSFIDYRSFPGGPAAFERLEFSIPVDEICNFSFVVASWLTDGMAIYRYMVIYKSTRQFPFWFVMAVPFLAYLGSVSLSMVWLVQILSPTSSPWSNGGTTSINFTAPYFWTSLSLNISMTIAICMRLLFFRKRVAKVLGPNHGSEYVSVAAIIVESSLLYSAFALLFLIPFALNNPIQNAFLQLMGEIQIIAPLLITYRVAYGAAWVNETSRDILSTKETRHSEVRVQVEFPGPRERPSDQPDQAGKSDNSRQVGEYEIGELGV